MPYYGNITRACENTHCGDEYQLEGTHYEGGQEYPPEFISEREVRGLDDNYCEPCQQIVDEGKVYRITLDIVSTEDFGKMDTRELREYFGFVMFDSWESMAPFEISEQQNSLVERVKLERIHNSGR